MLRLQEGACLGIVSRQFRNMSGGSHPGADHGGGSIPNTDARMYPVMLPSVTIAQPPSSETRVICAPFDSFLRVLLEVFGSSRIIDPARWTYRRPGNAMFTGLPTGALGVLAAACGAVVAACEPAETKNFSILSAC